MSTFLKEPLLQQLRGPCPPVTFDALQQGSLEVASSLGLCARGLWNKNGKNEAKTLLDLLHSLSSLLRLSLIFSLARGKFPKDFLELPS